MSEKTMPSAWSRRAILNRWFTTKQVSLTPDLDDSPRGSMGDLAVIADSEGEDVLSDNPPSPKKGRGLSRSHSNSFKRGRKKIENFFKGRKWSTSSTPDYILSRKQSSTSMASSVASTCSSGSEEDASSPGRTRRRRLSAMSNWSTVSVTSMQDRHARGTEEYIYRLVLHSIVSPLGAPDFRPGLRPLDLAEHLRAVFEVEKTDHDFWTRDAQNNRPSNVVLNVTVLEAKDLKPMDRNGLSDPYCILSVVSPKNKTPRGSPKGSPTPNRRKSSYEHGDVKKTKAIRETLHPKWNEHFELEVHDIHNDELLIYLWDSDEGQPLMDSMRHMEKPTGLKSLFRHIRQSVEYGRHADDYLGQFRVPLKDIPTTGMDTWFGLYEDKKLKYRTLGECRLKLELAVKQDADQLDSAESDQCCMEDYYSVTKQLYTHTLRAKTQQGTPEGQAVLQQLPIQSRSILDQFTIQHNFPRVTQLLIELVVLLELGEGADGSMVSEKLLKDTVVGLEREWQAQQDHYHVENPLHDRRLLTELELQYFERAATTYIENAVNRMTDIPRLFPPCELQLESLNQQVSVVSSLLNLNMWHHGDQARRGLAAKLAEKLQSDVKVWVQTKLECIHSEAKDPVIPETKILVSVIQEATTMTTPIYSVAQYFLRLGLDYYKVTSLCMESKLTSKAKELMHRMDRYQVRYQKFRVNIRESSAISLQLYVSLRTFFHTIRTNVSERELFKLTVANYQAWFETSVTFWLQTFKEECLRRMEKALEIDKDVVQVTSLVKYSNSSVDVLSCFAKMTAEWRQIDFCDADIALLGVTKITDTICDGARQYAEKIQGILEGNCYYDIDDCNAQFDVTDQLCITLNNIEHVRQYLCQLPHLLTWDVVTQAMTIKHENEAIGRHAQDTLVRLTTNAKSDILMRGHLIFEQIIARMEVDLAKLMNTFSRAVPDKKPSLDPLLDYLDNNLSVLYEKLENSIFPMVLQQIWTSTLELYKQAILNGKTPEYYDQMSVNLRSLRAYFHRGGIEETNLCTQCYKDLQKDLLERAQSSEQLMLQYLGHVADNVCTPGEYYGHLAVKTGYMEETGGNVTIYCKVENAYGLPGVSRRGLSDPFVSITLSPQSMFHHKPDKTRVISNTLRPVFNQTFQFPSIPREFLAVKGAVIIFTVWSHDSLLPNMFLGEVVVHMGDVPRMDLRQVADDMPALIMPLKRPREPTNGPYTVLQERVDWDKMAAHFLKRRRLMAGYEQTVPLCAPVVTVLGKLLGRKTEVRGQQQIHGSAPVL